MPTSGNLLRTLVGVALAIALLLPSARSSASVKAGTASTGILQTIFVPVRFCALQGGLEAAGQTVGNATTDAALLGRLRAVNSRYYTPLANVVFRSAIPSGAGADSHIPVIADTAISEGSKPGDIADKQLNVEVHDTVDACERAWLDAYPSARGIIVLSLRNFVVPTGPTAGEETDKAGIAPGPAQAFLLDSSFPGSRNKDLCEAPRKLLQGDVGSWAAVTEVSQRGQDGVGTLAHELGHDLLVSHGDGLDNDHDGTQPPDPGPRRFDLYCDSGEFPQAIVYPGGRAAVSDPAAPCTLWTEEVLHSPAGEYMPPCSSTANAIAITPLQAELIRDAARVAPGAVEGIGILTKVAAPPSGVDLTRVSPCVVDPASCKPWVELVQSRVTGNTGANTMTFDQSLYGPIPSDAQMQYLTFADLDDNPNTGCAPGALDIPTPFGGAELVSRITVQQIGGVQQVSRTAWTCKAGELVELAGSAFSGGASNERDAATGGLISGKISMTVSNDAIGPISSTVRVQALAMQLDTGTVTVLPSAGNGTSLQLVAPTYPDCAASPAPGALGAGVVVQARGLPGGSAAALYFGSARVASASVGPGGGVTFHVPVPPGIAPGRHPLAVVVSGAAVEADCAFVTIATNGKAASVRVTKAPGRVSRGSKASLTVAVTPGARCTIGVYTSGRRSAAPGIGAKTGTAITWTWQIASSTRPGTWPIKIDCGKSGKARTSVDVR